MVSIGSGAQREVEDYHLSRYACYLLVQNADPSRPVVALGQTYFAVQTRRQEIADELEVLPEDLPTPKESIQDLERKEQKRLKKGHTKAEE
jgi:hypothetical protein